MINEERLTGAVGKYYRYASGLLIGHSSPTTGKPGIQLKMRGISVNAGGVELLLPDTRNVFSLTWPLAANAIMLNGIVIVDTFLVSTLGEAALASMGLAAAIISLLLGTLFALSTATQILVAQGQGANDPVRLKSAFW